MNACRFTSCLAAALSAVVHLPTGAETYESWAARHFSAAEIAAGLAAPHGDHDGDACPNILEYCGDTRPLDCRSSLDLAWGFEPTLGEVTVRVPLASDREDIDYFLLVSNNLVDWVPGAVLVCPDPAPTFHLGGHRYLKIGVRPKAGMMLDSDQDGLSDHFEESLVRADPDDAYRHLGQILPEDDFDGDGILNIDEDANRPATPTVRRPPTISLAAVACAARNNPPPPPDALVVHTLLK